MRLFSPAHAAAVDVMTPPPTFAAWFSLIADPLSPPSSAKTSFTAHPHFHQPPSKLHLKMSAPRQLRAASLLPAGDFIRCCDHTLQACNITRRCSTTSFSRAVLTSAQFGLAVTGLQQLPLQLSLMLQHTQTDMVWITTCTAVTVRFICLCVCTLCNQFQL